MIYNILIIDTLQRKDEYLSRLNGLEDSELFFLHNIDDIEVVTQDKSIHIVLVNPDVIDMDLFQIALKRVYPKNYSDIPILIISDIDIKVNNDLIIFDQVSFSLHEKVFFNKIRFCQTLYQKELKHEENMQKILYVDSLTKLPNRAKLIQDIIQNESLITSIAILDINDFKKINDFYGLKIGDNILKETVNIIEDTIGFLKETINLYKFSADVYCLANKGLEPSVFEEVITFVLGAVDSYIFHEDEHEIDIKIKAGITFSDKKNKLITADIALQEAKKENKDYIVFYEELDTVNEYQKNMMWTKKLKSAMKNDRIVVYYQPLVNNETFNVDKYECLVRMIDEDGKVISPFFFLDISKKANQYNNITKIVIEKSFKQFDNLPFDFSVNVSYEDIADKYFIHFVEEKLKKYKVASRVTWEILEDEGIKDYNVLIDFINKVKEFGCKVSIDDFGSGYSNFEHLLRMNVDYLKIDASLIKNVVTDQNSFKVVKTVIDFAKSLELKTISEYVENEQIFQITKDLGSNYSQGYYFSAPIPQPNVYDFKEKE